MAFWDILKNNSTANNNGTLQSKVEKLLPQATQEQLIITTCIAGLLARVAYVDFEIHPDEIKIIKQSLKEWTDLSTEEIESISTLAINEIIDLAGLENHIYAHQLNELLNESQRYKILETLFAVAAADNNADNLESEEIRIIATGLRLSHQHFIAARAKIANHLGALK